MRWTGGTWEGGLCSGNKASERWQAAAESSITLCLSASFRERERKCCSLQWLILCQTRQKAFLENPCHCLPLFRLPVPKPDSLFSLFSLFGNPLSCPLPLSPFPSLNEVRQKKAFFGNPLFLLPLFLPLPKPEARQDRRPFSLLLPLFPCPISNPKQDRSPFLEIPCSCPSHT